jgi:hypothetical protein
VPYISAWRARERLLNTLNGDEGASFKLIPAWIESIKTAQEDGFYAAWQSSENGCFEALFVMLGPINIGIQTLRPFYALDGTHTRSRYNLTLLIAVGIDAEDHVLPLAFALVPIENEKWWSWFCEHFATALDSALPTHFVIISDREKGLLNAVKSKLPGAIHSMCCQHIAENVHKRFGQKYKPLFWQIARAQSEIAFEEAVQALRQDSLQVEEYLQSIGYETFAFTQFPHPRFGHDTSNIVESVNSIWREIRELPPLQLIDGIYQWTLTTFHQRLHSSLDSGNTFLSNAAYRQYKHRESVAREFRVFPSSDSDFRVTTSQALDFIVHLPPTDQLDSLLQGSCTCRKYQEYLAPCSHAIACVQYISKNPYDYFFPYYRWEVLKSTYEVPLQPVTIQGLQPLTEFEVLPPVKQAKRGRPKVARIRANYQVEKRVYLCTVCQQPGHNRRVCPNQPVNHGRAQRARDQLVEGKYIIFTAYININTNVIIDSDDSSTSTAQFSDWNGFSDSDLNSNTQSVAESVAETDQFDDIFADDIMINIWQQNLQLEQELWEQGGQEQGGQEQGGQEQGGQDQRVRDRRYPSRQRKRTVKAAAAKLGMY